MDKIRDEEINLFSVLETIWVGKWKIISFIFIFLTVIISYLLYTPNSYKLSTSVTGNNDGLYFKYKYLNDILEEYTSVVVKDIKDDFVYENKASALSVNASRVFEMFINEYSDYEEMIAVLADNDFVKNNIKDLNDKEKRKKLVHFAKNFIIIKPKKKDGFWTLSFRWHNINEGILLFNSALNITLKNVQKSLSKSISDLAKSIELENKRKIAALEIELQSIRKLNKLVNAKRTMYLSEQSNIAKELGIEKNKISATANLTMTPQNPQNQNSTELERPTNSFNRSLRPFYERQNYPFYLRGFKAIDKEIELIKDRSPQDNDLMSESFLNIKEELIFLEFDNRSSELKQALKTLNNDDVSNWVTFNFELAEIQNQNKPNLFILISIILGFISGIFYVFISNGFNERKNNL